MDNDETFSRITLLYILHSKFFYETLWHSWHMYIIISSNIYRAKYFVDLKKYSHYFVSFVYSLIFCLEIGWLIVLPLFVLRTSRRRKQANTYIHTSERLYYYFSIFWLSFFIIAFLNCCLLFPHGHCV